MTLSMIMIVSCNRNSTADDKSRHVIGDLNEDPTIEITQQPLPCDHGDSCMFVIAKVNNVICEETHVAFYDSAASHLATCIGIAYSVPIDNAGIAKFYVPCGITCFAITFDIGGILPVDESPHLTWDSANVLVDEVSWILASSVPR